MLIKHHLFKFVTEKEKSVPKCIQNRKWENKCTQETVHKENSIQQF